MSAHAIGPAPNVVPRSPFLTRAGELVADEHRRGGEPAGEALRGREDVGRDAVVLRRERLAGAAHAALDLVEDEDRAALGREPRASSRGSSRESARAPASPCTGSTMTAATSSRIASARRCLVVERRPTSTSNGRCGNAYHLSLPSVSAETAAVRPWNAPRTATTRLRRVARNATRSAFSFASAPEFTRKTLREALRARSAGARRAARSRTSSSTALLWKKSLRASESSVATSRGWLYPSSATAWPP